MQVRKAFAYLMQKRRGVHGKSGVIHVCIIPVYKTSINRESLLTRGVTENSMGNVNRSRQIKPQILRYILR